MNYDDEVGHDDTLELEQFEEEERKQFIKARIEHEWMSDWISMQAAMENPVYDKINPHFDSQYASLESVIKATIKVANKYNFAVVQELMNDENSVGCITHIFHRSGYQRSYGPFFITPQKQGPHGAGSAASYSKRYSLMAIFGVDGEKDDDGNIAMGTNNFAQDGLEELN